MVRLVVTAILVIAIASPAAAVNYLLNGGQASAIDYRMAQRIEPTPDTVRVLLNVVKPQSFSSPTYRQEVSRLDINCTPTPTHRREFVDERGNEVIEFVWEKPTVVIETAIALSASNDVRLDSLRTAAPFPPASMPADVRYYLGATEQVDFHHAGINHQAKALTTSAQNQFDAVQRILTWVVDHLRFVVKPPRYDAVYAFENRRGNCQNYSHLSAALMRAVGIPVRIVNGVTLDRPYDISGDGGILTMKMAQSRHSWIEVYFPDLGWVPFDPQGSELFVSSRFVRIEVGIDNRETEKDGLLKWRRVKGSSGTPRFTETIDADFVSDQIRVTSEKTDYGPQELLLSPRVETAVTKIQTAPPPPPPKIAEKTVQQLAYQVPFVFGNLDFPEGEDFLVTRGPAEEGADGTFSMRKNFLAETAEYVTTQGRQYAQTFVLHKPVQLEDIGLALHHFGSGGQLWVELFRDTNGMPSEHLATSDFISLNTRGYKTGYHWVDFRFPDKTVKLSPGRYWIALGFTGSPIVNWFFTYGKPVGPEDGTRYKVLFDEAWSRSLAFEFNYRVRGLTVAEQQ